jgi:ferredoxin-thioredoxin reductase catalytic chain
MQHYAKRLFNTLKKAQEPKGYFFNPDREWTFELLEGIITHKQVHGYMCCPCRLASGDRRNDEDIICPCAYRDLDLEEYGSCYCNLYVSKEWKDGVLPHVYVPERRPIGKLGLHEIPRAKLSFIAPHSILSVPMMEGVYDGR